MTTPVQPAGGQSGQGPQGGQSTDAESDTMKQLRERVHQANAQSEADAALRREFK